MNKTEILKTCVLNFEKQVHDLEAAAKASAALATDAEHRARSKYETFSLETSYLARGQAKRVAEMREALSRLRTYTPAEVLQGAGVKMGALVRVAAQNGEKQWYLLVPVGGGEEVEVGGEVIQLVTLQSPIAQVLMGKKVGESYTFAKKMFKLCEVL